MQKIALVLVAVGATQQAPAPAAMRHLRVMAGGDALCAERLRCVEKMLELDFAVAQHVRVRRAPGRVFGQEMLENAAPVFAGEVAEMKRHTQHAADRDRVAAIVFGAAIAAAVVGPILHEQPGDRLALLRQLPCGHRRIHAARHAYHNVRRTHARCRTSDSG